MTVTTQRTIKQTIAGIDPALLRKKDCPYCKLDMLAPNRRCIMYHPERKDYSGSRG